MIKKLGLLLLLILSVAIGANADDLGTKAQVLRDRISVRSAPNIDGKLVGRLYQNMMVEVSEITPQKVQIGKNEDYWYRINRGILQGWCFGAFLDFSMKNRDKSTYYSRGGMKWFFQRFNTKDSNYYRKIDVKSFNLSEYRHLMSAAVRKGESGKVALLALKLSILRHFYQYPKDRYYKYLKKRIYSNDYLIELFVNETDAPFPLLQILPKSLLNNKSFLLEVMKHSDNVMQFASDKLRNNKKFVLKSIKINPYSYTHADYRLKQDREVVMAAVKKSAFMVTRLDENWKNNQDILLFALKRNPYVYRYLSEKNQSDKELIRQAIKNRPVIRTFLSEELKKEILQP